MVMNISKRAAIVTASCDELVEKQLMRYINLIGDPIDEIEFDVLGDTPEIVLHQMRALTYKVPYLVQTFQYVNAQGRTIAIRPINRMRKIHPDTPGKPFARFLHATIHGPDAKNATLYLKNLGMPRPSYLVHCGNAIQTYWLLTRKISKADYIRRSQSLNERLKLYPGPIPLFLPGFKNMTLKDNPYVIICGVRVDAVYKPNELC